MTEFKQDDEITPVIFRKYPNIRGGEVIALFFEEPGTYDAGTCSSYVHVGQHGSADPHVVINGSRCAKPAEYADLLKELESAPYGYRLKVYRRLPRTHFATRRHKLLDMNEAARRAS